MKAIKKTLLALALAGAFTNANAIPVDWTFSNATADFTGVGIVYSINGSFTYDADTSTFSNVSIWISGPYDTITQLDANSYQISGKAATWYLDFATNNALTNDGGSLNFTGTSSGTLLGKPIYYSGTLVGKPRATATAVPEPEAYAMMLAGLGLVGFASRRKLS